MELFLFLIKDAYNLACLSEKTDGWIQLYTYNCSLKCKKYKVKIKVYLVSICNAYCVLSTILDTLEKNERYHLSAIDFYTLTYKQLFFLSD